MTEANFSDLLKDNIDDIEAPTPAPAGSYNAIVTGHEFGESQNNKTPYCRMLIKPLEPLADVDEDQFKEFQENDRGGWDDDYRFKQDFWLTPDAKFRLKNFLIDALGLEGSGRTLEDLIPESVSQSLTITLKHNPSKDGAVTYANIVSMGAAQ